MDLVLGLHGLPGAEVALVKTILRLSSTLRASWSVTESLACDVLLLGETREQVAVPAGTVIVPVLPRGEAAAVPVLRRPIRAEELLDLLNAATDARRPAAPARPVPATQAAPAGPRGPTARLKRWPPWSLLEGNVAHLRIATMLSKAAHTPQRVSELSGVPLDACEAFIRRLDAQQLLVWEGRPAPAAPAGASSRLGLFASLRSKLGIGLADRSKP
jgi:hypothetical protein